MGTYESRRAMHEAPSPGAAASSTPATEHLGTEVTNEKKAIFVVSVLSLGTMAGSTPFAAPPDPTPGATLPTFIGGPLGTPLHIESGELVQETNFYTFQYPVPVDAISVSCKNESDDCVTDVTLTGFLVKL